MSVIRDVFALGAPPWPTTDPFLFCVHHDDAYPAGNGAMGPAASLEGRDIGMDFSGKDGWRMYHGDVVPGFPRHPHRGFETITIARRGFIDHSDSLGATARFGRGDVQWMTAGRGIVHSEMFPLVDREGPNPTELFQIWLNLPHADKLVDPHFTMLWSHTIGRRSLEDGAGRRTELAVVTGTLGEVAGPSAPPSSWASKPDSDVSIATIKLAPGARCAFSPARPGTNRVLYVFRGQTILIEGRTVPVGSGVSVRPDAEVSVENGRDQTEILLLQGRPIDEPVAQHGPFVMTSPPEIRQAIIDYQRTEFGGWPWSGDGPVHPRNEGRFAIHADGHIERPE